MSRRVTDALMYMASVVAERLSDYARETGPNSVVPLDEDHRTFFAEASAFFAEASELLVALIVDKNKVREEATEIIADAQYCLAYSNCSLEDASLQELWGRRRLRVLAFHWDGEPSQLEAESS